jgi:hypothetical protein
LERPAVAPARRTFPSISGCPPEQKQSAAALKSHAAGNFLPLCIFLMISTILRPCF